MNKKMKNCLKIFHDCHVYFALRSQHDKKNIANKIFLKLKTSYNNTKC